MALFGVGYYGYTLEGEIVFMDCGAFRLLDLEHRFDNPEAVVGHSLSLLTEGSPHVELLSQLRQNPCTRGFEWHFQTHAGNTRWLIEDALLTTPSEELRPYIDKPFVESVVRDITMRKHKESVYLADQQKYQTILETIHEGYYEMDLDGRLTFFNRPLANMLGEPEETLLGREPIPRSQDEEAWRKVSDAYKALRNGASDLLFEWRLRRRDGNEVTLEVSISLIFDASGKPSGFRGLVRDVTDRVNAEEAFRIAERRYRDLFEEANDIVYTHDLNGLFTSLNKAGERVSGYTAAEAAEKSVYEIVAPEHREKALEMTHMRLQGHDVGRYELEIVTKDKRRVPVEINARIILHNGKPIGVQGIARDISERRHAEEQRRRLERQILHTQKLEGLGVLAGGIAHDFNNLLVGILGNAGLAERRLPKNSPVSVYMKRIEKAAQRAAELTNQMLAYSGRGAFVVRPLDMGKLAREIVELARAGIPKKILFEYDFESELPVIVGDVAQMHQVLMNVITNAAEAIGESSGTIRLSARKVTLDEDVFEALYFHAEVAPGEYVCFMVSDTGCGMSADQKSRIFDPFYSTKFTGRGLGLAALLGIVRGHKGAVDVSSDVGVGTTFKLYFPVSQEKIPLPENPKGREEKDAALDEHKIEGLALVADDEEAVRLFVKEVLKRAGMTVVTAKDGREAIALFEKHQHELRLVLLDLMMPHVNGQEVLEHIRVSRPDLPIILSSGYSEMEILERFRENPPACFIQKPYRSVQLVRALHRALHGEGSPTARP